MTGIVSRPYRGSEDLPALIDFASRLTAARFPGLTRWNPGDIAWQLGMFPDSFAFETFVRLWEADGRVVALAIFEPPVNFEYDIDPRAGARRASPGNPGLGRGKACGDPRGRGRNPEGVRHARRRHALAFGAGFGERADRLPGAERLREGGAPQREVLAWAERRVAHAAAAGGNAPAQCDRSGRRSARGTPPRRVVGLGEFELLGWTLPAAAGDCRSTTRRWTSWSRARTADC